MKDKQPTQEEIDAQEVAALAAHDAKTVGGKDMSPEEFAQKAKEFEAKKSVAATVAPEVKRSPITAPTKAPAVVVKKKLVANDIHTVDDLKVFLATNYMAQIKNFFGDEKQAMKFLSGVVAATQTNPKLMECHPTSVINSFVTMASLGLMPSNVSGEAYVLPYKGVAQFQLGYQGLVTLFYRAGARSIVAEIVRKNDKYTNTNGVFKHEYDPFTADRGEPIGAYVIVELQAGGEIMKVMSKDEILKIGKDFSKSYNSDFSPLDAKNDPQLWMWKKTVLKQCAKLVPKNETIYKALEADNEDSIIADRKRMVDAQGDIKQLEMGKFLTSNEKEANNDEDQTVTDSTPSVQVQDQ